MAPKKYLKINADIWLAPKKYLKINADIWLAPKKYFCIASLPRSGKNFSMLNNVPMLLKTVKKRRKRVRKTVIYHEFQTVKSRRQADSCSTLQA